MVNDTFLTVFSNGNLTLSSIRSNYRVEKFYPEGKKLCGFRFGEGGLLINILVCPRTLEITSAI